MVPAGPSGREPGSGDSFEALLQGVVADARRKGPAQIGLQTGAPATEKTPLSTGPTVGTDSRRPHSGTPGDRGPIFKAASDYIERGYAVVPLHGVEKNTCTCPKKNGKPCQSPGKHPVERAWQRKPIRGIEELRQRWDARNGKPTNIGILLSDTSRLLLIDVDVKKGKKGLDSLAEWERKLGVNLTGHLAQVTPSGGQHYLFRVQGAVDLGSLPNRNDVAPGIDVLRDRRQFVVSPSSVLDGRRYRHPKDDTPVSLPPIDELPEAPAALIEHLQSLGGDRTKTRAPVGDVESLRAPSVDKVREVVSHIPNNEDVDRLKYIWMAHRIRAACGSDSVADAREIFIDWASRYPGADPAEDERVFDTLNWANVEGGWDDLWHLASRHGYDASEERSREAQEEFEPFADSEAAAPSTAGKDKPKIPVGVKLFRRVLQNPDIEVFHSRCGKRPHVRIRYRDHWQTHALDSSSGVGLLRHVLSQETRPPSTQAFNDTLQRLRDHARFAVPGHDVFVRVARMDNAVYVDLGDDSFRAVEITSKGWRIVDDPPVWFVRNDAMLPLPTPVSGGSVADFKPFFSTSSDDDLRLLFTFMVDTFAAKERSHRPILAFDGPPGSAKTTMTDFVKQLTDPQVGGLSAPSKDERDLVIAARWSHVVAFDNTSTIPQRLSDALCRLTTGGGVRTRKLYSDEDETIFDERRHVVLNSIGDVAKQNDLRDRCLFISAAPLKERRDDSELREEFELARPRLLGLLCDAVSAVLASEESDQTPFSELPRMAGFARRGMACAEVFGWSGAQFLAAYRTNIEQAALDYLEDDLVARTLLSQSWRGARAWLRARLAERGVSSRRITEATSKERWGNGVVWRGSASDLLAYLEERVGWDVTRKQGWPRGSKWFGRQLKMASDSLQKAGWKIEFSRNGRDRIVEIRRIRRWDGEPPDLDDTSQPPLPKPPEVGGK